MPSTITMVRHGQASLGSANYDQLSPLGYEQSRWLGEYLAKDGHQFDLVITGAMARHKQTADALLAGAGLSSDWREDARWNEFHFEQLVRLYLAQNPELADETRTDKRQLLRALKLSLHAWVQNQLPAEQLSETWAQFEARVVSALAELPGDKNILIVSSGGALSMALCHILKAAPETMISLNLQTANTAVHQCIATRDGLQLTRFNHLPHLADKAEHTTFF